MTAMVCARLPRRAKSLKSLLPSPKFFAKIGVSRQKLDYVVLRLDTEGNNPFHTLYHEYTHALLRLNFSNLPLWLNEGLAEFFGNTTLGDKEIKTGTSDPGHLYLLNQSKTDPRLKRCWRLITARRTTTKRIAPRCFTPNPGRWFIS